MFSFSAITTAGSIGTNVATGAAASGQAGGFTGFPIGVGGGAGTQAGGNARLSPKQIQQYMTGQLEHAEVQQGRPTGGTGFHYGSGATSTSRMSQTRRDRSQATLNSLP